MPSADLVLGLRSLYIIPSRFGALWLCGTALLLLVAIQTGSNSSLLLAFLMVGLMLLAMFLTHDSLQGLSLYGSESQPGFAGASVQYAFRLRSRSPRQRLQVRFQGSPPVQIDALPSGDSVIHLSWLPDQRGWQLPPRLIVDTVAPLGLFICWTRWQPRQAQLIWPARRSGPVDEVQPTAHRDGLDEWQDLRPYRDGDRQSLVDWSSAAKGRPLQVKRFQEPEQPERILAPASGIPRERALQHLADRIWRLHQRGEAFGLQLQGRMLPVQRGRVHRDACLELLALA